ncbi:hypothetical protein Scep_016148 [Stephania cephalantha]|uniref:Uncharacterized protein n=1 Tax=Stephania cephalantha TaxID=152367 RepID=A0AAP0IML6_9MAGN
MIALTYESSAEWDGPNQTDAACISDPSVKTIHLMFALLVEGFHAASVKIEVPCVVPDQGGKV